MKEERDSAVRSASRARKIAEDVLQHNKKLEESVKAMAKAKDTSKKEKDEPEAKDDSKKKGKWQKPWEKKEAATEGKTPIMSRRIDESRKVAAPAQSTRPMTENKTRNQSASSDIATIVAALGE